MLPRITAQTVVWIGAMAVPLFLGAGDWGWTQGWAFVVLFGAESALFIAWLIRRDPALLESRMHPLAKEGQPWWDRLFLLGFIAFWFFWLAFMAADAHRWRWSHVPGWLEIFGALLVAGGFAATMPVFAANSFAAPTINVQNERGQHVIDTGPYALVRHPMYAAAMLYLIGIPLLLGSWFGLIGSATFVVGVSFRAMGEERKLARELPGYADYMARVPWRLVPYLW
jgi:protein-S-isoprenylcysteine O-methyltransferase Ste14